MRVLRHAWPSQGVTHKRQMLWAAGCTCFHGFLRSGEATVPSRPAYDPAVHLSLANMSVDSPGIPRMVAVRIKASKPDPFREGVTICLGRTDNGLGVTGVRCGPGYGARPAIQVPGQDSPHERHPGARSQGSAPMRRLGPVHYSGHGFRIGAATTAAAAVVILGRWHTNFTHSSLGNPSPPSPLDSQASWPAAISLHIILWIICIRVI